MWSILRAIKRSWTQYFVSQFSGFIILSLSYTAALFIALALTNVQSLFDVWGRVNQVTVYLNQKVSAEERSTLESFVKSKELVKASNLVSSEESAKRFSSRFNKLSAQKIDTKKLSSFFPEFYEVQLNEDLAYKANAANLDVFVSTLKAKFDFVKSVSYGKSWLQRYVSILHAIKSVGWALILLFMVGAIVVTSSVIKTILFNKKEEIEIMEFVGADDSAIYLPQIVSALFLSTLGFGAGVLANYLIYLSFLNSIGNFVSGVTLENFRFLNSGFIIAAGVTSVMGVFAYSLFTIYQMMPRQRKAFKIDLGGRQ